MAEAIGVDQKDPKALRLPRGLEDVSDAQFGNKDIEKLIVTSSIRRLGAKAFNGCEHLREVVFEPESRLESICEECFCGTGLRKIVVPRSVLDIKSEAFSDCSELSSLSFEEGSRLRHVGAYAFAGTGLELEKIKFPAAAKVDREDDDNARGMTILDLLNMMRQ